MRLPVGSSRVSSLVGAIAALWLCGAGSAWAGGGMDLGSVQAFLNDLCPLLGMTSCPQLPTITQVILEIAALENSPPDLLRSNSQIKVCTVSGLPFPGPVAASPCDKVVFSAVNPPALSSVALSDLTPLGFISPPTGPGPALPVAPGASGENSFLYAVTTGASGQPDTLHLFYDYLPQTNAATTFAANVSLPLEVLNKDGTESLVPTILQIQATCANNANCLTTTASGDFLGIGKAQTYTAAQLGLNLGLVFGASPNSGVPHTILEVPVPLLVTGPAKPAKCGTAISNLVSDPTDCGNDPAYFGVTPAGATNGNTVGSPSSVNQLTGLPTAFATDALGFPAAVLKGVPVGIAPYAAPPCPGGVKCPSPLPSGFQSTFPFCASFSVSGAFRPAVAAFFAIGTDGTTYVSAPVASSPQVRCPF